MRVSPHLEIVRELEDKIPCPSCGSYWMDPVILGKGDWLIGAFGLAPRDAEPAAGPTEQVECHGCRAEPEIDVMSIVRAIGELGGEDRAALARLVEFKRQLVAALIEGQAVATPFGLFFGRAWAPRLERVEDTDGFVRITARRTPQFLPSETFLLEVSDRAVPASQIRACMERAEAGGFWDVERNTFCEIATGIQVPKADLRLDVPGLYDDVLADLRATRSSPLRGIGSWVVRRVGDRRAPRELVEFCFWRGFCHVLDRALSRRTPPQSGQSGRSGREQPEVVYVFFDHARSAPDPRRSGGSTHRGLQKRGEAASS